jgi:isopentenyldiphosphate isomerase
VSAASQSQSPAVEMIDIVDADNRVIGCGPRREVHRLGLRHRAVHMLVLDRHERIYLQRRSPHKDVDPNLWDTSAAGHVDAGEDYHAAALRELHEELALDDVELRALCDLPARVETGQEFVRVYLGHTRGEPRPDPREIAAGGWWERAELEAWMARSPADFTGTFHLLYAEFRARNPRSTS